MKKIDRLLSVGALLATERGATVQELLKDKDLGYTSRSSIYSDFENLRKLKLNVYDEEDGKRGDSGREVVYRIDKAEWDNFRKEFINTIYTEDEKLMLSFMFESFASTSPLFSGTSDKLIGKLKSNIVSFDSDTPSSKGFVAIDDNANLIKLLKAQENETSLYITYNGKKRKVFPLKTFTFSGGIYTYVMNEYGFVYTLALQRIEKIETTSLSRKNREERPEPKVNVNELLADPFGIVIDNKHEDSFKAVIKLDDWQGLYEAEKAWPDSVTLEDKGEYYLFSVFTHGSYWLKRWVLSLGETAEILEPDWLREEIKAEIDLMKEKYN